MTNHSMPLLGGPMHGMHANERRVVVADVPRDEIATEGDDSPFGAESRRGIYTPVRFAMCGRVIVVGVWEAVTDSERDDLIWELVASDAAKEATA